MLTQKEADAFVESIRGKTFTVTGGTKGEPEVSISASAKASAAASNAKGGFKASSALAGGGPRIETTDWGLNCGWAWFAAGGYYAATTAMCGAVGAFALPAGIACSFGFNALGTGINWNNAC